MSLAARWNRLDAARWVHRLLVLQVALLVLVSAVSAILGLVTGAPVAWLLPAGLAGLAGWISRAWDEERPWSWWAVLAPTALGAGSGLLDVVMHFSPGGSALLVLDAVVLALLAHPDSTARLRPPRSPARPPQWAQGRSPQG